MPFEEILKSVKNRRVVCYLTGNPCQLEQFPKHGNKST